MEFFEKAHVVKKETSRKDSKSEEAMKKQLKKMLFGYKLSDNKLLKSCENATDLNEFDDDSSSVSGFSDLNLTNSSNEADQSQRAVRFNDEENCAIASEDSYSEIADNSDENSKNNIESITEYDVNNLTLSDDPQSAMDSNSDESSDLSIISSKSGTSEEDSVFDANGGLATKILEKLDKHKLTKRPRKRKSGIELETQKTVANIKNKQINKGKKNQNLAELQTNIKNNVYDKAYEDNVSISSDITDFSDSPAFISLEASEMSDHSLKEILGHYKYPTVKNLPSDIQITNNSNSFSIEAMNVEDIEEDVSSSSLEFDDMLNQAQTENSEMNINKSPITEDVSVYDNTIQSEPTSEKEMSLDSVEDAFVSPINYYCGVNSCIFILKHPAELFIHGKVQLKVLGGALDLFGYRLKDKLYEVYAPKYNYAHCVKTVASQNLYNGLFSKLTAEGLSVSDAEEIVTTLGENDGVISMRRLDSRNMDFVENNMTAIDLFSKNTRNVDQCFKKVSEFLGCSLYLTRQWKSFEEVTCWRKVAEYGMNDQSRGIVCGGKGVGKSTFLRYYVNKLLSRGPVLVLDLDPGQAEFTVAGSISATVVDEPLLGPSFTHLKTPHMMLNIGMINTMDNPRRYATAVRTLISHCCNNEQLKSMPWVINTMGLCNAMGLKFMTLIILQARPSHLLQIDSKNAKKRFEMYLDSSTTKKLYEENYKNDPLFRGLDLTLDFDYSFFVAHHTENPVKRSFSLPARDERYLNFLAYFGELLSTKEQTDLLGIVPYEVKLQDLHIGLNVKINEDAVTKVINGKIIALCQLTTQDKGGDVFTLRDKHVLCHGHGLIRGIDLENQMLYIITPMPHEKLSLVNTLVYADWVPELRGQERQLPAGITVPYRTATMYQRRQLMFAPKRRFNPLQLLKMTRNS
ncbi:unnamed protein product [Chilo suppressalis]|uniref:Polynucleotide 5'-hydroxyl-kinase NOL9 n=1 Tax=Chilo suppressalis TaxID=168631 RepID=A0ABN8AYB3_CHISP|nr:unnamed protein product [Chilo suppressalis]